MKKDDKTSNKKNNEKDSEEKGFTKSQWIGMIVGFGIAIFILQLGEFGFIPAFLIAYGSYWISKEVAKLILENNGESESEEKDSQPRLQGSKEMQRSDEEKIAQKMLDTVETESNFTFVAENTTKYYLELQKKYKDRFPDEASLLVAAGVIDTGFYILVDKTITIQGLMDIAQEAVSSDGDSLLDFIINLEVEIFKIDCPNMSTSEIEEACEIAKEDIVGAIEETKSNYKGNSQSVVRAVRNFMESSRFEKYRRIIGIRKDKKSRNKKKATKDTGEDKDKLKKVGLYAWRAITIFLIVIATVSSSGAYVLGMIVSGGFAYWLSGKASADRTWGFMYGLTWGIASWIYYAILIHKRS